MPNKANVEIQITLQFKDQYNGDGTTEPTREQVKNALIEYANGSLNYKETRIPVIAEDISNTPPLSGIDDKDAEFIHEQLKEPYTHDGSVLEGFITNKPVSPLPNRYIRPYEQPVQVSNALETFIDIDDAMEEAHKQANLYSQDNDPFNEE